MFSSRSRGPLMKNGRTLWCLPCPLLRMGRNVVGIFVGSGSRSELTGGALGRTAAVGEYVRWPYLVWQSQRRVKPQAVRFLLLDG